MHTPGLSILTTELAATDRRALSEAWYAALHVTQAQGRPRPAAAASRMPAPPVARAATFGGTVARYPASALDASVRGRVMGELRRIPDAVARERRATASPLARRVGHAVATATRRTIPSAVTIADRAGRVVVMVHTRGDRTHVVALCSPALRDAVERALAHARFALAGCVRIEAA
jgi:hypothetical protein